MNMKRTLLLALLLTMFQLRVFGLNPYQIVLEGEDVSLVNRGWSKNLMAAYPMGTAVNVGENNNPSVVGHASGNSYRLFQPTSVVSKLLAAYNLKGVISGVYDIYLVTVPNNMADKSVAARPTRFNASLAYDSLEKGSSAAVSVTANTTFLTTAGRVDTVLLFENFKFSKNYSVQFPVLMLQENFKTTELKSFLTSDLGIDCIILKAKSGIAYQNGVYYSVNEEGMATAGMIDSSATSISIPDNVMIDGKEYTVTAIEDNAVEQCKKLNVIEVNASNQSFCSVNNVLFDKQMTELIAYPALKTDKNYIVPKTVTKIFANAFCNQSIVQSVDMGNDVTELGAGAFKNCTSLERITLSKSIKEIKASAFENCASLKEIIFPEKLVKIDTLAFAGCNRLSSLNLPDSLMELRGDAFANCTGLVSVVFGSKVTSIRQFAFRGVSSVRTMKFAEGDPTCIWENFNMDRSSVSDIEYYGTQNKFHEYERAFFRTIQNYYAGKNVITIENRDNNYTCIMDLHVLTIGSKVTSWPVGYLENYPYLETIYSQLMNPLVMVPVYYPPVQMGGSATSSDDYNPTAKLYVPEGTESLYKVAEGWKKFFNIEESKMLDAISTVPNSINKNGSVQVFDLQGRKLNELQKGINIINGKKVLIR